MVDSTLAFNILARDRGASSVFDKVARSADKTSASLAKTGKISDSVAKASANLTKAHNSETTALDRVQVAEAKLAEVRGNSNAKVSQTLAAEKALAKARRDAAVAGNVAQKAAKDLGQALDNEGKKAGKGFGASVKKWFAGDGSNLFKELGKNTGNGILGAITGALKTPVIGPIVATTLAAAVATVAPAVGAVAGAGLVAGFGAGIAGLGLVFAAKSAAVGAVWSKTMAQLGADMKLLSQPFEGTLISIAGIFQRTVGNFNPVLRAAFSAMAGPVATFVDQVARGFEKLIPAIGPITTAFNGILGALGPAMVSMIGDLSSSMTDLANSVAKNPQALADTVRGFGGLVSVTLGFVKTLNDINTGFSTLTSGTSLVTVVFEGLKWIVEGVAAPFQALGWAITGVNALLGKTGGESANAGKSMSDAANKTIDLANGFGGVGAQATHGAVPVQTMADKIKAAGGAAAYAMQQLNGYIASMFKLQNLALGLSGAQINLQKAIDDATASVKTNGKTLDINTEKGRANKTALDSIATSANAQTESMLRSGKGVRAAATAAEVSRATFVTLAMQMGVKNKAAAEAMARALIAVPKKSQTDFKADIRDLSSKIATAKTKLADPHLSATKKAQLRAEIGQLLAAKAQAQRAIDSLSGKTVSIQINTYKNLIQTTIPGGTGVRLPGRAIGGPVKKGQPYWVGEEGPEPFVPDQNGTIIPNGASVGGGSALAMGGGVQTFRFEVAAGDSGNYTRFLIGEIQKHVKISGGNVQLVLGKG